MCRGFQASTSFAVSTLDGSEAFLVGERLGGVMSS